LRYNFIKDIRNDPEFENKRFPKSMNLKSLLSFPLSIENVPVGVINIYNTKERTYTNEEIKLLKSLSNQAAIMIENSKLYNTIKVDKENLSGLLETSQAINSTLESQKLQEKIQEKLQYLRERDKTSTIRRYD